MSTAAAIAISALKELLLATVAKIAWKTIAERFFTRVVLYGLRKLQSYTDNDVVDQTVNDIIKSLEGKRLYVIENEVAKR
jgi:membrane protein implicated in regulation of membrane protease activity